MRILKLEKKLLSELWKSCKKSSFWLILIPLSVLQKMESNTISMINMVSHFCHMFFWLLCEKKFPWKIKSRYVIIIFKEQQFLWWSLLTNLLRFTLLVVLKIYIFFKDYKSSYIEFWILNLSLHMNQKKTQYKFNPINFKFNFAKYKLHSYEI